MSKINNKFKINLNRIRFSKILKPYSVSNLTNNNNLLIQTLIKNKISLNRSNLKMNLIRTIKSIKYNISQMTIILKIQDIRRQININNPRKSNSHRLHKKILTLINNQVKKNLKNKKLINPNKILKKKIKINILSIQPLKNTNQVVI